MRALLASTVGVACAAALVTPVLPTAAAGPPEAGTSDAPALVANATTAEADPAPAESGETRSLPLRPLDSVPRDGESDSGAQQSDGAVGLAERDVEPFSLVGLVWDSPDAELAGEAEVRTRSVDDGTWSAWHELHAAHGTEEGGAAEARGGTDALWVGVSDAVEVRISPRGADTGEAAGVDAAEENMAEENAADALPEGIRLDLVDPGAPSSGAGADTPPTGEGEPATGAAPTGEEQAPAGGTAADPAAPEGQAAGVGTALLAHASQAAGAALGAASGERQRAADTSEAEEGASETREDAERTTAQAAALGTEGDAAGDTEESAAAQAAARERELDGDDGGSAGGPADTRVAEAPRPGVVIRSGWGADESWRTGDFSYTDVVKTVFVHHSAGANDYSCEEAPSVIRGIYQYHTQSLGWRDIGYNFLVDKCGTIYEGRAGGVDRAVLGAHTYGFNHNSMGVALLGTYENDGPSNAARDSLAQISGWKLSLDGRPADGTWNRVSAGGKYSEGTTVEMHNISGHRDGYDTACPGEALYGQLSNLRTIAAGWK